jgi:hypothetical protein
MNRIESPRRLKVLGDVVLAVIETIEFCIETTVEIPNCGHGRRVRQYPTEQSIVPIQNKNENPVKTKSGNIRLSMVGFCTVVPPVNRFRRQWLADKNQEPITPSQAGAFRCATSTAKPAAARIHGYCFRLYFCHVVSVRFELLFLLKNRMASVKCDRANKLNA